MTSIAAFVPGVPRVNLMPRSEIARRERDRLVRLWVWISLGAIVVALLIVAAAFALKFLADQRLVAERARTDALSAEILSLVEVSQALSTQAALTDFRQQATAADVTWGPVVDKIASALPGDAALVGFQFTIGGVPSGEDLSTEPGAIGTASITSPSALDIVSIVRDLRDVDGVLFADGQSVVSDESAYAYILSVQFDQTLYAGEYAATEDDN